MTREAKRFAGIAAVIAIILVAVVAQNCGGDDERPARERPAVTVAPSPRMSKDAVERICAAAHGVPKWWRPDRDYHNCVDRLS